MDGSLQSVSQTETSGGMVQLVLPPALVSVFSVTLGECLPRRSVLAQKCTQTQSRRCEALYHRIAGKTISELFLPLAPLGRIAGTYSRSHSGAGGGFSRTCGRTALCGFPHRQPVFLYARARRIPSSVLPRIPQAKQVARSKRTGLPARKMPEW